MLSRSRSSSEDAGPRTQDVRRRFPIPRDAFLLAIAFFMAIAAANVLTPLLPLVQKDFKITLASAGLLVSAFGTARLALDLPAGFLEEHLGPPRLAGIGFILLLAGSLLAAFGPSFPLVVAGRAGMGLGCSVMSLVVLSALSNLAPPNARARVLMLYPMANNTAISIFPLVGAAIGQVWGWRSTMLLCAALACASVVLLTTVLRRNVELEQPAAKPSKQEGAPAFHLSGMALLAIGVVCLGAAINMINRHGFRNTALPLFAAHQLGLNSVQIASGVSVIALTGLVVAIPGGILADRWSRRGVIACGFVVLAIGDLTFLHASSYMLFLLSAFILGSGDFFSSSQTAALTEAVPRAWRSRSLALYRFSVDLGAAIGPILLAGLLQLTGFQTMVLIAAGLLLFAGGSACIGALSAQTARHSSPIAMGEVR